MQLALITCPLINQYYSRTLAHIFVQYVIDQLRDAHTMVTHIEGQVKLVEKMFDMMAIEYL
jgi:hypothetical protein